ncbi:MAG: calcium/sodium antiporter [Nanoarchaeota archaeon]|nr:calcium/sodium antiporter [Nanoarchaeota archaeon]MBU1029899.1 calcium/sodium antiporter [Nanoarchaeota archaeon]MBU1849822.1 calcium/sodium antiporter [Nanoarchaeota archaeon]
MITIILWIIMLIVSIIILVKSADFFTTAAEKIGLFFKMSPFIIGVTIVSIGTSLPELASSILAVIHKSSEIVVGNVVGSNIANILLVFGASVIITKLMKNSFEEINFNMPLLIASTILILIMSLDGTFSFIEGLVCIFGYIIYLGHIFYKKEKVQIELDEKVRTRCDKKKLCKNILVLLITTVAIYFSAKYTVVSIIKLSEILSFGTEVIAATVVALGTSLPELSVTIIATKKGKSAMAIGNVLGSNIFNSFIVIGISALISNLKVTTTMMTFGVPFMFLTTLLFFFIMRDKKVSRWKGWMFILLYLFFIVKLFGLL